MALLSREFNVGRMDKDRDGGFDSSGILRPLDGFLEILSESASLVVELESCWMFLGRVLLVFSPTTPRRRHWAMGGGLMMIWCSCLAGTIAGRSATTFQDISPDQQQDSSPPHAGRQTTDDGVIEGEG